MKRNKIIIIFIPCIILLLFILFLNRESILYKYYKRGLENTSEGALILDYNELIVSISDSIVNELVNDFEDKKTNYKIRQAATLGLIKADKKIAEELFVKYLNNGNIDQTSESIYGLYLLKNTSKYENVIVYATHKNDIIRKNVALYLGSFKSNSAKQLLLKLSKDNDSYVRYCAKQSLGVLE
jgi:HEAT repeat protein